MSKRRKRHKKQNVKPLFTIFDDFNPHIDAVRESALRAGFGTWAPNKGEVGSSIYEGMSFWGDHAAMVASLTAAMGQKVYPNTMFFRVTRPGMEPAYIHSDREMGSHTCVVYLTEHPEDYGTGFYRHRELNIEEMPTFAEMANQGTLARLGDEMVKGDPKVWEQTSFVRGKKNRAVIFHAPLFHSRLPREGLGSADDDSRMVWVCHFYL